MGPKRPPGVSLIARRVARQLEDAPYEEGANPIIEMEQNLEAFTTSIPKYVTIDDVPLWYQRHTVGVSARLHRLLGRVIIVVSCYHEHHVGG